MQVPIISSAAPPPIVVALGASAGGLPVFSEILEGFPADSGMTFVFIQHLDPHSPSLLASLLSGHTAMPVVQVTDGLKAQANHAYVIPPGMIMTLEGPSFRLEQREPGPAMNLPIDRFLRSLARHSEVRSIGVILSGAGSDGSLGVNELKASGGLIFAQEPATAAFDSMPVNAIGTGHVDFILPPDQMAAEIVKRGRVSLVLESGQQHEQRLEAIQSSILSEIFRLVNSQTGIDFSLYKQPTMLRRIGRRMALHHVLTLGDYVQLLRRDAAEVSALQQDFLIQVTQFFRDGGAFDVLRDHYFPTLARSRGKAEPIRVWVAGCATGEEAYSVAICLLEATEGMAQRPHMQVFATDIQESALAKARQGVYLENIDLDVSPARLKRFFTRTGSHQQVAKQVRDLCVFARQNVISDPPFSHIDFISCRNMLIYMNPTLQRKVMPIFHYALKPTGHLMLGQSESTSSGSDLFTAVDRAHKIYAKRILPLRTTHSSAFIQPADPSAPPPTYGAGAEQLLPTILREADKLLMQLHPGVIVDDKMNIIQFRGDTGAFLVPASGMPSFNLLKMVKDALLIEIRRGLHQAKKEGKAVKIFDISLPQGEGTVLVDLAIYPFKVMPAATMFLLINFMQKTTEEPSRAEGPGEVSAEAMERSETAAVLQELYATKDYLHAIISDHERTNEELRAANEEILSTNEELQSTNEELETAKEEMQSTNEELKTLNEELNQKNSELGMVFTDLGNLFAALYFPVIIVDMDLSIRRFSAAAKKVLRLTDADVGRHIDDIRSNLEGVDLHEVLLEAVATLHSSETEVRDRLGQLYVMRIKPVRAPDHRIDGMILTFGELPQITKPKPDTPPEG